MTPDNSIPTAKNYLKLIYFVFKLGEPALLGSNVACISQYPWQMKNGIKKIREKHHGCLMILKMVNDPLRVWKENHSITMFQCYFCMNKGHDHILLVDNKQVTEVI